MKSFQKTFSKKAFMKPTTGRQFSSVLVSSHKSVTEVVLNRPKALNAVDLEMVRSLYKYSKHWNSQPNIKSVYFKGAGGKAFCAGGDIRSLYDAKFSDDPEERALLADFFREEYRMDYALSTMNPLQVCLYNGIVMGGGVGVSIHSPVKIATDNSLFAMPETYIGFFCDVGGSYFLPRLGPLGSYLALTGDRVKGVDLLKTGIATHFIPADKIEEFESEYFDAVNADSTHDDIKEIIAKYNQAPESDVIDNIDKINQVFGHQKVEDIFAALGDMGNDEWAEKTLKTLKKMSPLSVKVVHESLIRGAELSLKDCFIQEFRMSQQFMSGKEFFEGVRAALVDKDHSAQWTHKSIEEVTNDEVEAYFQPLENDLEL